MRPPVVYASEDARHQRAARVLRLLRRVELEVQTREEASEAADVIADLFPEPLTLRLGLTELILNGVEHGNLEIGSQHKCQLLHEDGLTDEIDRRLASERYRDRRVRIRLTVTHPLIEIAIRDDGPGFDWRRALTVSLGDLLSPNGRGIALVRDSCFPELEYRDPGNVAVVRVAWPW